jgi:hypothetical protein
MREDKNAMWSYEAHMSHHKKHFEEGLDYLYALRNPKSLERRTLCRVYDVFHSLLKESCSWLTIGDFTGVEAMYLTEQSQKAMASDISDVYIKEAHRLKLIDAYDRINVEQIEYGEDAFDYVLCKESFHHFPRAYLGLYEMIRVAKKGVVLIEPTDAFCKMSSLVFLKNFCDLFNPNLINKLWKNRYSWEVVGNYVFKLSEREVEKAAMGMGLPCIAFKGVNIRLKPIPESWGDPKKVPIDKRLERKLDRYIARRDLLCKLGIIPHNNLCAIIFKEKPSPELLEDLRRDHFQVIELPPNPYLH